MNPMACNHQCTSNCRREGCNCSCGEYHCDHNEKCRYEGEECPNHPKEETKSGAEERIDDLWWDLNRTLKEFRIQKTAYDDTIYRVRTLVEIALLNELIEEVEKMKDRQINTNTGTFSLEMYYDILSIIKAHLEDNK